MKNLLLILLLITTNCYAKDWVCINRPGLYCNTWVMEIPQGYIVASDNSTTGGQHGYAMVFVPDTEHIWKY